MKSLIGLFSFLIFDAVYLYSIKDYYGKQIRSIQGSEMEVKVIAAAVVYALIGLQWYYFIFKNITKQNMKEMLLKAFLLGVTTYGIFDFTSHALLKNYTLKTALIDTFWGGTLYFLVTLLQYKL